jgi:ribonuclease D
MVEDYALFPSSDAQVAELVDALASGASDRKVVEVRVFSWAPTFERDSQLKSKAKSIEVHQCDLPDNLEFGSSVAVDTETLGLKPNRDRLCLVQVSAGDGTCHLVQFPAANYEKAHNLKTLFTNTNVTKIFHFARFDVAIIKKNLGVACVPVYCTKIASRLARTYTGNHGLKDVSRELVGVELNKEQQSSDWAIDSLSAEQIEYAAADVLYLHKIKDKLDMMLIREGRDKLAKACFEFLPTRTELDLAGWREEDIFSH